MGMIIIIGGIVLLLQLLWSVFCAKASAPAKIRLLNFAWFFCWLPC
ncbi:putative transmembrane protein [Escherichia coli P0304777.2]|nr:putative transmembrane protein [Escherichia coli MP021017.3]EMU94895.1 putative transmembrane protein [Escherichia coli MP021017.2]EMV09130.1 putative transmembrane protein [Escherichia coli MP021017.11]EMZ75172.1 putative transmembrane protein [Escherichia coli 199900.1]ENA13488.1 putative transmembrane protein [Escherichia coli BCE008_MS-13]ENA69704.1 putative transmembrane protein [Escherichia coli 178900]ENE53928.1 putative transmembrane protein [Escherichia coli P0304777.11]ENE60817.